MQLSVPTPNCLTHFAASLDQRNIVAVKTQQIATRNRAAVCDIVMQRAGRESRGPAVRRGVIEFHTTMMMCMRLQALNSH